MASFNDNIIEIFRANDGVVGMHWEGKTLILLHHIGRRSGKEYVTPLVAAPDADAYVICASMGGAPATPGGRTSTASGATTGRMPGSTRRRPTASSRSYGCRSRPPPEAGRPERPRRSDRAEKKHDRAPARLSPCQ